METSFAEKLNDLFARVHPPGEPPATQTQVVQALTQYDVHISQSYLSTLRTGRRTNPAPNVVEGLARFFGVTVDYFYDEAVRRNTLEHIAFLQELSSSPWEAIAARGMALSPDGIDAIKAAVEERRRLEGLD